VPKATFPGEKVHSDHKGSLPRGHMGETGFYNFVDSHTGLTLVAPVQRKTDLYEVLPAIAHHFSTHSWRGRSTPICTLYTDNGGEYASKKFQNVCIQERIKLEHTIPYTPEQNGIAERNIRTLSEMMRAFIGHAKAPTSMWPYALKHSAYVLNRLPRDANPGSAPPLALWNDTKIGSLNHIPVWYAPTWVLTRTHTTALAPVSKRGRFLGIAPNGAYIVLMDESKRFQMSRSVRCWITTINEPILRTPN
jgi:hypothetical protein